MALVQTTYRDFNDCHATEQLRELEGLPVSRSTVRRLRRAVGLPPKHRRRPPQHRARRPRRSQVGALVLIDGSEFDWLGTGTRMLLLGAIDDATSTVVALHFRPAEDLHGYLTLVGRLAARDGLPVTLYGDRLAVFVRNDAHWTLEEQLQGDAASDPLRPGPARPRHRLHRAHSPQAKGRIERLWATLQDRLVADLHRRGIHTRAAAEAFLPTYLAEHNRRFAQPPAEPTPVWQRPPRDLADRLSCRYHRRVARDNTVRLGPRLVQIPRGPTGRSYAGCRVEVRECLDGRLLVDYQGRRLVTAPAPTGDFVLVPRRAQRLRASRSASEEGGAMSPLTPRSNFRRPPRSWPWRRPRVTRHAGTRGGTPSRVSNAGGSKALATPTHPQPAPHRGGHFH